MCNEELTKENEQLRKYLEEARLIASCLATTKSAVIWLNKMMKPFPDFKRKPVFTAEEKITIAEEAVEEDTSSLARSMDALSLLEFQEGKIKDV